MSQASSLLAPNLADVEKLLEKSWPSRHSEGRKQVVVQNHVHGRSKYANRTRAIPRAKQNPPQKVKSAIRTLPRRTHHLPNNSSRAPVQAGARIRLVPGITKWAT